MKQKKTSSLEKLIRSHKLWLGIFLIWLVLISGIGMNQLQQKKEIYKPGIIQAFELYQIKKKKEDHVKTLENNLRHLEIEKEELIHNPIAQQRAIRKVLGYAQKNELVFDFSKR